MLIPVDLKHTGFKRRDSAMPPPPPGQIRVASTSNKPEIEDRLRIARAAQPGAKPKVLLSLGPDSETDSGLLLVDATRIWPAGGGGIAESFLRSPGCFGRPR